VVAPQLPAGALGSFVRGPRATGAYARALLAGRERRYLSHNPGRLDGAGPVGWRAGYGRHGLAVHHRRPGARPGSRTCRVLAWAVLLAVPAHVLGVVFTSWRHRENLVAAMLHGRKRLGRR
jgi:cytochrome b